MNLYLGELFRGGGLCSFWNKMFRRGALQYNDREKGGAMVLVILFLPMALLSIGLVADLGVLFTVKRTVQAACDFGALAACQELDWDLLAEGQIVIDEFQGKAKAIHYTRQNLQHIEHFISDSNIEVIVRNIPDYEPTIVVQTHVLVQTSFIKYLPGLRNGVTLDITSESSVVKRTKW